jgi:signal transduction histidine kinase
MSPDVSPSSLGDEPGAEGPFRRPGLLVRIAPFAVIAIVAEASLALTPHSGSDGSVATSLVLLAVAAATMLLPWRRIPSWLTVIAPLAYCGSVLALNLAGGPNSGVGLVLLIPVIWCALFQRWGESVVVAAAVVAVEAATSVAQSAPASVTARRVVLWALLSAVILVAAHRLRDGIARSHARSIELQDELRELTVARDRDRIAAGLHDQVISRLFAAGMTVQGAMAMITDAEARRRLEQAVTELDEAIVLLRHAIFGLSARPRETTGLRQRVLDLCGALDSGPEIELVGSIDSALTAEAEERLLALLREALTILGTDGSVTAISVATDAQWLTVGLTARVAAGDDQISYLRERAQVADGDLAAGPDSGSLRLTWRFAANVTKAAGTETRA